MFIVPVWWKYCTMACDWAHRKRPHVIFPRSHSHCTLNLQWLPSASRIKYKLLALAFVPKHSSSYPSSAQQLLLVLSLTLLCLVHPHPNGEVLLSPSSPYLPNTPCGLWVCECARSPLATGGHHEHPDLLLRAEVEAGAGGIIYEVGQVGIGTGLAGSRV